MSEPAEKASLAQNYTGPDAHEQAVMLLPERGSWMERIDDWCNAILVKETRQAFKSRQFVVTFMLLLAASWVVSIFVLLNAGAGLEFGDYGRTLFFCFFIVLAIAVILIVPFTAFRSLLAERDFNTYDLLSITALKPRQIVWGKLLSAMVQLFIFYSAITPFVAFASLLQGFDAPSAAFILTAAFLVSILGSMAAIMLASLARTKAAQGVMTLMVLGGLLFATQGVIGGVFGAIAFQQVLWSMPEFWWATGFALLGAISYFLLFQQIAIAQLTFESDNRSTGVRIVLAAQFWLLWIAFAAFLAVQGISPDAEVVMLLATLSAIHWTVTGIFASTEGDHLSRRVRRGIPRSIWLRIPSMVLIPGGARGFLFCLGHIVALWAIVVVVQANEGVVAGTMTFGEYLLSLTNVQSSSWTPLLRMTTGLCCYATIYLGIACALGRWCHAISSEIRPAHVRVLTVLVFTAALITPPLLKATGILKTLGYSIVDLLHPWSTLFMLSNRTPSRTVEFSFTNLGESLREMISARGYTDIVLVLLGIAALTAVVFNLGAAISGTLNILRHKPGKPSA